MPYRRSLPGLLTALLVAVAAHAAAAKPPEVRVFASSSLAEAIDSLSQTYDQTGRAKVVPTYGPSGDLAIRIESGAKADLFLSSEDRWMEYLLARQLVQRSTVVRFVSNDLVLVAAAGSDIRLTIKSDFPLAAALGSGGLALANPDTTAEGRMARTALEALGVWPSVQDVLVIKPGVRAALAAVAKGQAPIGIGYASDAAIVPGLRVVDRFPSDTYTPILYPMALVRGDWNPAATTFFKFLRSRQAENAFRHFGFHIERPLPGDS